MSDTQNSSVSETPAVELSFADLRRMLETGDETVPAAPEPKPETETATPADDKTTSAAADEKTTSEDEPEENDAEPTEPVESQEPESVEEKSDGKKPSWANARLSKMAKDRDRAREEAAEARREAERVRQELEEVKAKAAAPREPEVTALEKPEPPDASKHPEWSYDDLEAAKLKYAADLVDWKVAEAVRQYEAAQAEKVQKQQAQEREQTLSSQWETRAQTFLSKTPEFEEAVNEVGPFLTQAGVADLIKQSEVGPEIVMHLYQNPEVGEVIAKLGNPLAVAAAIGRLEKQLTPEPHKETSPSAPRKRALPPPPKSEGGGGTPPEVDLNSCDMRTFKREAAKLLTR